MLFLLSSVRNVVHTNILKAINTVRRLFKKDLIVCLCAHVRACVCTYMCVYAPLYSCLEPAEARGRGSEALELELQVVSFQVAGN